jgi:hypothetical protein
MSIHRNKLSQFMNTRSGKLSKIKRRAKNTYIPVTKTNKKTKKIKRTAQSKSKIRRRQSNKNTQNTQTNTPKYSLRKMISNLFK